MESLAGTGKVYHYAQFRLRDGKVHVQIPSGIGNRGYGCAFDLLAHTEFMEWLNDQDHTERSLADTKAVYVPGQIRTNDNEALHIQISGTEFNRPYGYSGNAHGVIAVAIEAISLYDG